MSKRIARLNEQLKRELSLLIRTQVRDPRVGLVTITGVEVAADLGSARVFVRVTGGPEALRETLEGLDAASPFLRSQLGRLLHVRRIPELRFREDRSHDGALRIEQVLADVSPPGGYDHTAGDEVPDHGVGDGDGADESTDGEEAP